jgi:ferrous-iron efflux pump FieF
MVWCEAIAFACVLAAAWPANSLTLWASVLRVGLDLPASFFALYVSRRILRQQSDRFDYGLGKWENLAALINVPVMFAGLAFLAFRAVLVFLDPRPVTHTGFGLVVLLVFGAVNVALMLRFRGLHRQEPTPLVHAQYVLYRNATAASLLSVLALLGSRLAGAAGGYFDILGAAILAILILQSAFVLLRQSLSALLDEAVEESLQQRIVGELAGAKQEYLRLHRIRSRHSGGRIFIELFLEFEPEISVREMLDRSQRIRRTVEQIVPGAEVGIQPCESRR